MIRSFFRMLTNEFNGYNGKRFLRDLLAGLTVAAVSLPLALAFGVSSGVGAAAGLVTAIIGGLVIGIFTGGYYQISGPTGTMAAILIAVGAQHGIKGVLLVTFMAGFIRLVAGIFRLGKLTAWIPAPVITGFTSGIAIIIALGQVNNFFGVTSEGSTAIEQISSYFRLGFSPNFIALGVGVFVVLFMAFFPKKINAIVPSSLIAIILTTAIGMLCNLEIATVGAIPQSLMLPDRLSLSGINLTMIQQLLGPAISIALLGMIESLLCGMSAQRMTGVPMLSNQELVAQGIGNMVLPFFGGIPATAAIARTSVAIKAGANTRLAGILQSACLMLAMFFLAPVISQIPLSALAGVLLVTAWRMNEWPSIRTFFSRKLRSAILQFLVTMAATVIFDLSIAILIGIGLGLIIFVMKSTAINISVSEIDLHRMSREKDDVHRDWVVVYITGPLFFMTSETIKQYLETVKDNSLVLFSIRGVPMADVTTTDMIQHFCREKKEKGHRVLICGAQPNVTQMFTRMGIVDDLGEDSFYFSVDKALNELLDAEDKGDDAA